MTEARSLASDNPDALARNLLRRGDCLKTRQSRVEIWHLLQNLGSDAAIKRAIKTIERTRSFNELEAVLEAASADLWHETAPAIARRLHREAQRLNSHSPAAELAVRFDALAMAAIRLGAALETDDIVRMLTHPSARLRAVGVRIVTEQGRADLIDNVLPLCGARGEAGHAAAEAVGALGQEQHAAVIWSKALEARKSKRTPMLMKMLNILGEMGAFDVLLALRTWIGEDAAKDPASVWKFGKVWSSLCAARYAAGEATEEETVEDLNWLLDLSDFTFPAVNRREPDYSAFHIAEQLHAFGDAARGDVLLMTAVKSAMPTPDQFPGLTRDGLPPWLPEVDNDATQQWKVAVGEPTAVQTYVSAWRIALCGGTVPDASLDAMSNPKALLPVLEEALDGPTPGVVRQVLTLLTAHPLALPLTPVIERLASEHPSTVVRWKAKRVLQTLNFAPQSSDDDIVHMQRWVRLDAALLTGAIKPSDLAKPHTAAEEPEPPLGLKPPERAGKGYRLVIDGLAGPAREATVKELAKAPLSHALDRRAPNGPAYEDRPDIRAIRELAAPNSSIDEHMVEMAKAVMEYWSDGDEPLTLDEDGVALVAASLATESGLLDEDDVAACGAFIGEVLRKRIGGSWAGFDDHYLLEVQNEVFDPIAWTREIHRKKDPVDGTRALIEKFREIVARLAPASKGRRSILDPRNTLSDTQAICSMPLRATMPELLAEARVLAFRLMPPDWPIILSALDPLVENGPGVRAVAAIALYAPGDMFGRMWAHWGAHRRENTGLTKALIEAMEAAAVRDDLEAMPNWTFQSTSSRHSFLNALRKKMTPEAWQKVLLLQFRQRAAAGDRAGVGWCLYSYKYEFPDALELVRIFCDMSVSARQTILKATVHCTRDELKLFRPLWAEGLRDPSEVVTLGALEAVGFNRAKALRPLVEALEHDGRQTISIASGALLRMWEA